MTCPGNPKIIIITPRYLPLLGGMERQVQLLAEEFARRSYRVVIITELLDGSPRQEDENGIRVIRVGARRYRPDPLTEPRGLFDQVRSAVAIAYHVIHNRRGTKLGIIRTFTLPSVVVGALKRVGMLHFPTIVTAEIGGERDDAVLFSEFPGQFVLRAALAGNDGFNALCSSNVGHMVDIGIEPESILSIPNGIVCSRWETDTPATTVRRFLYFGRLDIAKGILDLVDAFAAVHAAQRDVRLDYIGDGPAAGALDDRIAALGLTTIVKRRGSVAHQDLPEAVRSYDCVVLPSYSEAMPLSVLEASSAGRHLIVSDIADLRQLLGDSAACFPAGDIAALETAMTAMANQHDASTTAVIGRRFDVTNVVDQYEEYASVRAD